MKALWQALRGHVRQLGVIGAIALLTSAVLVRYQYEFEHEAKFTRYERELKELNRYAELQEVDRSKLGDEKKAEVDAQLKEYRKRLGPSPGRRLALEKLWKARWPGFAILQSLELKSYDERMRTRRNREKSQEERRSPRRRKQMRVARDDIVIIAIDAESMQSWNLGTWPFARECHARVVDRLSEAGAKLICFDVMFDSYSALDHRGEQDPNEELTAGPDDQAFVDACRRAGNVVLAAKLVEQREGVRAGGGRYANLQTTQVLPIPELEDAVLATGFINVTNDLDAFIRSSDTVFHYVDEAFDYDEMLPFFGPMIAGMSQGLSQEQIGEWMANRLKGKKRIPYIAGSQALINYVGPRGSFRTYPYYHLGMERIPDSLELLNTPEARREQFEGKIVLIGGTADELRDNRPTPFFEEGEMPGVEIHANAAQMFLDESYLTRARSRVSGPVLLLLTLFTGFITVLVGKPVSTVATRIDAKLSFSIRGTRVGLYGVTWFVLYLCGAMLPPVIIFSGVNHWLFFERNLVLPLAYPLEAAAITYLLGLIYMFLTEEQERKRMHGRFERFVAPSVLTEILTNPADAPTAKKVEATLIFTDLQGFTTLSEQMEPEEVVEVLNDYLDRMTNVVFKHGGTIDKFIGDAIMVIFGAPIPQEDHPLRAVKCAVEMQEECSKFRAYGRERGWPDFFMRIGIHTDGVVVGSIGSSLRMDYTAIGDGVNLAARLEAANKEYGTWVMCSIDTLQRCGDAVEVKHLDAVTVKGKTEAVDVYQVLRLKENGEPVGYDLREIDVDQESSESAKAAKEAYGAGVGDH